MRVIKQDVVSPVSNEKVKINNFYFTHSNIARQLKYLTIPEVALGINRLDLIKHKPLVSWLGYICNIAILLLLLYYIIIINQSTISSYLVFKDTTCFEYLVLIVNSVTFYRSNLKKIFEKLNEIDTTMNVNNSPAVSRKSISFVLFVFTCVLSEICINLLLWLNDFDDIADARLILYLTAMAHDYEIILFSSIIRIIYLRLRIIKAHVNNLFPIHTERTNKLNDIEILSKNTFMDTSKLHEVYDILCQCAQNLNLVMSLPMSVMLICSGISTTMLLNIVFKTVQFGSSNEARSVLVYVVFRCVKYTTLVIMPCYYCHITGKQVAIIRARLHDAVSATEHDKAMNYKVKAFLLLARENGFDYALWSTVKLNMTLPLSYSSLCTTYLVIIIQFSKFID